MTGVPALPGVDIPTGAVEEMARRVIAEVLSAPPLARRRRRRDIAHPGRISTQEGLASYGTGTGLPPSTSAPGLGSAQPTSAPGLAPPAHICTRTGLSPAHICTGTGLPPPTSAPGLTHRCPHLHQEPLLPRAVHAAMDGAAVARRRCERSSERSPRADVGGMSPVPGGEPLKFRRRCGQG